MNALEGYLKLHCLKSFPGLPVPYKNRQEGKKMKYSRKVKYQMKNRRPPKRFFTEKKKDDLISFCLAFLFSLVLVGMIFIYIIYV